MNVLPPLPSPIHDPEALFSTRWYLRCAYESIRKLRQADPTVRDILNRMDEMCGELTVEIDTIEPHFQFRPAELVR